MMHACLKQRNFKAMLRTMRAEMGPFLGYKDCSIMFFSEEKHSLYTITEN
jgi:hypothetical protein